MATRIELFTRTQAGAETPLAKAEDTPHVSGEFGLLTLGVRAPATPTTPTSAAGDYGFTLLDVEGKGIASLHADPAQTKQGNVNFTTTSDVALVAAGGAGVRTYITTLTVENTGGAAARFILKDGSTVIFTCTVPANDTRTFTFDMALRGTANAVVNGALGAAGTVTVSYSGYAGV